VTAPVTPSGTPLGAAQGDLDAVEAIVRAAGTSFYRGMRVLPPSRRHAMYAIYAFCRVVDDIADDETVPLAERLPRLADWRARIADLYGGVTDGPVTRVLAAAVQCYALRQEDFLAVIDGMQMDAETPMVAPDLVTLDLYCDRVAAAVGRLSVRAFGDASAAADRVAYALGRALQLTNILRDVQEDAERGRLYLPREYLDAAEVPHDPLAALGAARLPEVCSRVAALAHAQFRAARAAMVECDRQAMRPARLMGATYAAILARLERRGWARLDQRVSLPAWQKLWVAVRYGLAA
jgi:presqualene diphosphate synthase